MKTYLFTHTDLDGVGCAVVATMAYPLTEDTNNLEIAYVHYGNVNEVLLAFIKESKNFDTQVRVHITDICPEKDVGKEICAALDRLHRDKKIKLFLCDHHDSSEWVKQYSWAWHATSANKCGTKLYADFLRRGGHSFGKVADEFAECVCAYDNWLLDHPLRPRSEGINRYLWFVGFARFVYEFSHDPAADLSVGPMAIVDQLGKNERSYVRKIVERQCVGDFVREDRDTNKYCVMVCERNVSQVCHAALDAFPELDYAMCLNATNEKGDLRSRDGGVDVSKIAERLGGGGRRATAGFMMPFQSVLKLTLKDTL